MTQPSFSLKRRSMAPDRKTGAPRTGTTGLPPARGTKPTLAARSLYSASSGPTLSEPRLAQGLQHDVHLGPPHPQPSLGPLGRLLVAPGERGHRLVKRAGQRGLGHPPPQGLPSLIHFVPPDEVPFPALRLQASGRRALGRRAFRKLGDTLQANFKATPGFSRAQIALV